MYLLDTDIIIWLLRGKSEIVEKVLGLKNKAPLAISVTTIAEVYKNIFPSELTTTEEHLGQYITFDIDKTVAKIAGLYWQEHSKKLKTLSLIDCFIAATANVDDLILVSLNSKHFPMKDIQVLNPLK